MTADGAQARSIMRWAWQDPAGRAVGALERVNELAAAAQPGSQALLEIQDAGTMLSRLVGTLNTASTVSAQLAGQGLISQQLDLAAIHGHHVPGTQYTFRHGWIPVLGPQLVDKYPSWMGKEIVKQKREAREREAAMKAVEKHAQAKLAVGAAGLSPIKPRTPPKPAPITGRHAPAPMMASERKMTPEMQALLDKHRAAQAQQGKISEAIARGTGPATPRVEAKSEGAASAVTPREYNPAATTQGLRKPAMMAMHGPELKEAAGADPATDPHLASMASPGMDMAALKAYVDARVAAEVARQVGQITARQETDLKDKLAKLHQGQQRLIKFIRKTTAESDNHENKVIRTKMVMNNLFNLGALGVAIGGIQAGLPPLQAAMAAAVVPLANIIHDYARKLA